MTNPPDDAVLSKLSDSGQPVSSSEQDIRGLKVKDKDGNDLGKVEDLLIDDLEHKVRFLLVEHGGFLGMGQTKSFIPVDGITMISNREVHINHSKEHVANAPGYDPKLVKTRPTSVASARCGEVLPAARPGRRAWPCPPAGRSGPDRGSRR